MYLQFLVHILSNSWQLKFLYTRHMQQFSITKDGPPLKISCCFTCSSKIFALILYLHHCFELVIALLTYIIIIFRLMCQLILPKTLPYLTNGSVVGCTIL